MTSTASSRSPELIRPGLLPGILAALTAMAGILLVDADAYIYIRFVLSILALIIAVFAFRGRKWLWIIPLAVVAVIWNPVFPLNFEGLPWRAAHVLAAGAVLTTGLFLRVPERPPASRA